MAGTIIFISENSHAYRITKDKSTGNIYYTGYRKTHIGIVTPSGENIWLNADFAWEDLDAIEVHPGKGYLEFN